MAGTTVTIKRCWAIWTQSAGHAKDFFRTLYEEFNKVITDLETLRADVALLNTRVNLLRSILTTGVLRDANPTFAIDTNFDIKNTVAFHIVSGGVIVPVAANVNFDTGTATVITTAAGQLWAAGVLSIDVDGTTGYVDWGAEAASEALAIAALSAVTPSGDIVVGYVAVQSAASQDWVAGTDALEGGTGGQVSTDTNYYNVVDAGNLVFGAALTTTNTDAAADMTAAALSTTESGD